MVQRSDLEADDNAGFGAHQCGPPQYKGTTRQSVHIPMRDGVRIAAEIVLPKNLPGGARIPALLSQTRYWRATEMRAPFKWFLKPEVLAPAGFKDFQPFFTSRGYALVLVDVRGTGASFGTWPHPWASDSIADAGQVVDWIVSQPWSNGKVGGYGISYSGTTAELLAALGHPAVAGVIPMFNHPDAYTDIAFPGGIFDDRFIKAWGYFDRTLDRNTVPGEFGLLGRLLAKGVKPVDVDGNRQLLRAAIDAHATNGDVHRLAQTVRCRDEHPDDMGFCVDETAVHRYNKEIERSSTAVFGWGSWMDAGTADAVIRRFLTYSNAQRAVIGAWDHHGRFHASPYQQAGTLADPSLSQQWVEMLRFFDCHLKGIDNGVRSEKVLFYYTMGEERWKKTQVWPPEGTAAQRWYLGENGLLSLDKPAAQTGCDTYAVDFEAGTGEYNRWWEMGVFEGKTVMYSDRAAPGRHLLTYTTPPLENDTEITGYPVVALYVTSTETDGAFYVYFEDVDETGRVTYVTEGQLRAMHRKVSSDEPPYKLQVPYHTFKVEDMMPLVPGEITEIAFGLYPTSVLIKRGHRIRLGIAGHDKGTFARIPESQAPVVSVARNSVHASHIDLPVAKPH